MTLGYNRNCQQFPHILGHCGAFLATQYKKILQEEQVCLNRTQEHKNQTVDNSKYTIFYLAKGFEGLYLECYRNQTKLLLTLKIILKIV